MSITSSSCSSKVIQETIKIVNENQRHDSLCLTCLTCKTTTKAVCAFIVVYVLHFLISEPKSSIYQFLLLYKKLKINCPIILFKMKLRSMNNLTPCNMQFTNYKILIINILFPNYTYHTKKKN